MNQDFSKNISQILQNSRNPIISRIQNIVNNEKADSEALDSLYNWLRIIGKGTEEELQEIIAFIQALSQTPQNDFLFSVYIFFEIAQVKEPFINCENDEIQDKDYWVDLDPSITTNIQLKCAGFANIYKDEFTPCIERFSQVANSVIYDYFPLLLDHQAYSKSYIIYLSDNFVINYFLNLKLHYYRLYLSSVLNIFKDIELIESIGEIKSQLLQYYHDNVYNNSTKAHLLSHYCLGGKGAIISKATSDKYCKALITILENRLPGIVPLKELPKIKHHGESSILSTKQVALLAYYLKREKIFLKINASDMSRALSVLTGRSYDRMRKFLSLREIEEIQVTPNQDKVELGNLKDLKTHLSNILKEVEDEIDRQKL